MKYRPGWGCPRIRPVNGVCVFPAPFLDPSKLQDEVISVLKDAARPGHPHKYTQEQIIRIQETACRPPEEYGFEASHWSLNKLRDAIIREGIVDDISVGTVSYFLK